MNKCSRIIKTLRRPMGKWLYNTKLNFRYRIMPKRYFRGLKKRAFFNMKLGEARAFLAKHPIPKPQIR